MSYHLTHANLLKYTDRMNAWARMLDPKAKRIDLRHFTEADRRVVLQQQQQTDESPENLTCDGELQGKDLAFRVAFLKAVRTELETL